MLAGGKIVGEGGQACVIKPSLEGKKNRVTKIESQSSSIVETEISYFLSKHDPKGHFGIYSNTRKPNCDINASKIVIKEGALDITRKESKCKDIANKVKSSSGSDRKYCAFSMEAYTHDLDTIPNESVKAMYRGIINLWDALELYHSLDVIHGDIKLPNVAYRQQFSGKPEMFAFADWGWSARLRTSTDSIKQLAQMTQHRDYASDKDGIWAPILWSASARKKFSAKNLLKYNDVHSLALMTADFFRQLIKEQKVRDSDIKEFLVQLNDLLSYSTKYIGVPTTLISERLRGLLF